jgi:hypothetical protein
MNNIIDQATAQDAIITGQASLSGAVNPAFDLVLLYDASAAVPRLRKATVASLQSSSGITEVSATTNPFPSFINLVASTPVAGERQITLSFDQQQQNKVLAAPDDGSLGQPTFRAIAPMDVDSEISIAALQINWQLGHFFSKTLTGNSPFTFVNPSPGQTIKVHLIQDASHTATWPAGVRWPGGTDPVMTPSAGAYDLFTFHFISGSLYLGTFEQNFLI